MSGPDIIAVCPSCEHITEFTYIGAQEDGEGGHIDLWNCDVGHTLSTNSIVEANAE